MYDSTSYDGKFWNLNLGYCLLQALPVTAASKSDCDELKWLSSKKRRTFV